jgi:hypothetical protein
MTADGLRELNSRKGFRHLTRAEAKVNGRDGCDLCAFLHRHASEAWGINELLTLISPESDLEIIDGEVVPTISTIMGSCVDINDDDDVAVSLMAFAREGMPFNCVHIFTSIRWNVRCVNAEFQGILQREYAQGGHLLVMSKVLWS